MLRKLASLAGLAFIISCNGLPPINPCDIIQCNPGYHCENGKCVPNEPPVDPCSGITCDPGFHCEDGKCVADPVEPPVCLPDLPWCNELNPPAVCGKCKHNPTQDPNYCEEAPPCAPIDPCDGVSCETGFHCENGKCIADPVIPPDPPTGNCPKTLAPGSVVYMNENNYGMGFDSTVRVRGDAAFCFAIHGVNTNDCHLDGWHKRVECEMELLGGCPIWQFSVDNGATALQCHDDQSAPASCDHFGNVVYRDDPKTPNVFEGEPKACGLQKNQFGPYAGFFTIAHGAGLIRACKPDGVASTCGPWRTFNH